jgi:hypothetical protein
VANFSARHSAFAITLDDPGEDSTGGGIEWVQMFNTTSNTTSSRFWVNVPSPLENAAAGRRKDGFEWRVTSAHAVSQAMSVRFVYSLVRLTGPGSERDSNRHRVGAVHTDDGHEVLAAWCENQRGSKNQSFRFFGPGAAGELGSRWELMAVASALCTIVVRWRGRIEAQLEQERRDGAHIERTLAKFEERWDWEQLISPVPYKKYPY